MKKIILFILCCNFANAQKLSKIELLNVISNDICNEISINNIKVINEQVLGVQMLKALKNHREDVIFYYGEDYFVNQAVLESLGEEVGLHLGLKCPEIFAELVQYDEDELKTENYFTANGKLTKISKKNLFLTFIIKEKTGKTHEFILLNSFETSYLLTDELLKTNDEIEVTFYISDFYDARINKYVNYNVVSHLEKK